MKNVVFGIRNLAAKFKTDVNFRSSQCEFRRGSKKSDESRDSFAISISRAFNSNY